MLDQRYNRPYRVFHGLVNYGTQAGLFARGLRAAGVHAYSLTSPDAFDRITDQCLRNGGSPARRLLNSIHNYLTRSACLFRYDIFHFYFGTSLWPKQLDLRLLKALNRPIIMEYLGLDIQEYQKSISNYRWTNMAGRLSASEGAVHDAAIRRRAKFEQTVCSKRLVCAPVYSEFAPGAEVLPLAIDVAKWKPTPLPAFNGVFKLLHLPTHKGNKGTNYIIDAVSRLKSEGHPIDLKIVQGVSHSSLHELYSSCHLFVDQILGGWYGTASIEAMSCGRPVVVSIRDIYRGLVPFGNVVPAIDADPDTIYLNLKSLIQAGYPRLVEVGLESRRFVEKFHDIEPVVDKLVSIYDELWRQRHSPINL